MPKIAANMVGTIKCPSGKDREDFWLEGTVDGFQNLILGVRVSRNGNKKWMARYRVGGRGSSYRRVMLGGYGNPKNGLLDYQTAVNAAVKIHLAASDGKDPAAKQKRKKIS